MRRETNAGVVVAGILVVGAVLVLALRSTSTEITVFDPVTLGDPQDAEPDEALVIGKRESGGFSILGLQFGHVTYRMSVQFFAPPGCFALVESGDPWPTPFEECTSAVPITGNVAGQGITATGESIIAVELEVPGQCYEAVARGDSWPSTSPACATAG